LLGRIWSLEFDGSNPAVNTPLLSGFPGIATFGLDEAGEIYMSNIQDGRIYRFASTITSVAMAGSVVHGFKLEQNYPNPFNPSTTINYSLPAQSHTVLIINDLLGKEIRMLLNGTQAGGVHSVVWDGRNNAGTAVASGIYIYRLTAGQFASSRRLLFLK
jgi:hypothetical protein